jgi:hypothetical protein
VLFFDLYLAIGHLDLPPDDAIAFEPYGELTFMANHVGRATGRPLNA